jgi:hypothetical protein
MKAELIKVALNGDATVDEVKSAIEKMYAERSPLKNLVILAEKELPAGAPPPVAIGNYFMTKTDEEMRALDEQFGNSFLTGGDDKDGLRFYTGDMSDNGGQIHKIVDMISDGKERIWLIYSPSDTWSKGYGLELDQIPWDAKGIDSRLVHMIDPNDYAPKFKKGDQVRVRSLEEARLIMNNHLHKSDILGHYSWLANDMKNLLVNPAEAQGSNGQFWAFGAGLTVKNHVRFIFGSNFYEFEGHWNFFINEELLMPITEATISASAISSDQTAQNTHAFAGIHYRLSGEARKALGDTSAQTSAPTTPETPQAPTPPPMTEIVLDGGTATPVEVVPDTPPQQ